MKSKTLTRKSLSVTLPVDLIEAAREQARRRGQPLREAVQKLLELYARGLDPDDVVLLPRVNSAADARQHMAAESDADGRKP